MAERAAVIDVVLARGGKGIIVDDVLHFRIGLQVPFVVETAPGSTGRAGRCEDLLAFLDQHQICSALNIGNQAE
jgi:hypothetical protein